jgi:hypothetical protein
MLLRAVIVIGLMFVASPAFAQQRQPARQQPATELAGIWSLDQGCAQSAYLMRIENGVMDVWSDGSHISRLGVSATQQGNTVRIRIERVLYRAPNNPIVPQPGQLVTMRRDGDRLIGVETRQPNGTVVRAPPGTAPLHPCVAR